VRYAPWLIALLAIVVLMAGPGPDKLRAGRSVLLTVGGVLLMAIVFGLILFRD
jgi:hypothetical protein